MIDQRPTAHQLTEEARRWENGELTPIGWVDAPEAVPRAAEAVAVSIPLPRQMLDILTEFARRAGVGHQVLIKQWLDDRLCEEHQRMKAVSSADVKQP